jgi:hypothetical protein
MEFLTKSVCLKQWQVFAMLLLSGYATGAMLANIANALGL